MASQPRLPRVLLALLAGLGLAIAEAGMQAHFRTLPESGVAGVTRGAAVGSINATAEDPPTR